MAEPQKSEERESQATTIVEVDQGSSKRPPVEPPKPFERHHIVLTTHPGQFGVEPVAIKWGDKDPFERGPIIATTSNHGVRNAIGTHYGSYSIYRALAFVSKKVDKDTRSDLTNTEPYMKLGPHPSWFKPEAIVTMDPWGADVCEVFGEWLKKGYNVQPTIAITRAHINIPELLERVKGGHLHYDNKIFKEGCNVLVTKAAYDPVWYLPGVAKRLGVTDVQLRRTLFEQTAGMFPELITRPDLDIFLPPIGGATIYMIGDPTFISDPTKKLAVRVHDECNGSDVFGSDICTCRPYLVHGLEACIRTAQEGGAGLIVYNRKEGRALGEVTKYLVYNARKRQEGGDTAAKYFERTECVAGCVDARFQSLMPDPLHYLGITKIDTLVSMSDDKYNAIVGSGIKVIERIPIPPEMIPADAHVEMDAKVAAGYYTNAAVPDSNELLKQKGRSLDD